MNITSNQGNGITLVDYAGDAAPYSMALVFREFISDNDVFRDAADAVGVPGGEVSAMGSAVNLPIPSNLSESFDFDYSSKDAGAAAMIAGLVGFGLDLFTETPGNKNNNEMGDSIATWAASQVNNLVDQYYSQDYIAAAIRNAAPAFAAAVNIQRMFNPNLVNTFDGVNPRAFTFSWKLYPDSPQEAAQIQNIVKIIRERTHPEEVGGGAILKYPDVVDAIILGKNGARAFPIATAVVTNLAIDYSGSGLPTFMVDGTPTTTTITINLLEMRALTRNKLQEMGAPFSGQVSAGGVSPVAPTILAPGGFL